MLLTVVFTVCISHCLSTADTNTIVATHPLLGDLVVSAKFRGFLTPNGQYREKIFVHPEEAHPTDRLEGTSTIFPIFNQSSLLD